MNEPARRSTIAAMLGFTLVSRAVGFLRELIIAAGFGFSQATDAFYQLAAAPTYLITYICGPFATAYIAWVNGADAPDERECRVLTAKFLMLAAGAVSVAMVVVAAWLGTRAATLLPFGLPQVLMAASCVAVALIGFCATVANARGHFARAQSILFANNLGFVLLLGAGAIAFPRSVLLALTAAFAAAAVAAMLYGLRMIAPAPSASAAHALAQADTGSAARQSAYRTFLPMLGYASIETLGFLMTQGVVLALASSSGVGVASAASLAQRIALTMNGLVINPLSNVAMVRLSRLPQAEQHGYLVLVVTATLGGLAVVAAVLSLMARYAGIVVHSTNGALLASLIPAYALWLVAQGTNTMLSRMSFARGSVRIYTGTTVAGYALANLARLQIWHQWGFAAAIAAGSAVELMSALLVLLLLVHQHGSRAQRFVPPTSSQPV